MDLINDIKNRSRSNDPREDIKKQIIGTTVMTVYNKRTYRVDDIDFTKSLKDSFAQEDGQ